MTPKTDDILEMYNYDPKGRITEHTKYGDIFERKMVGVNYQQKYGNSSETQLHNTLFNYCLESEIRTYICNMLEVR